MVAVFVIATILVFVLIEVVRQRIAHRTAPAVAAKPPVADSFVVPRAYFISRGHSWAELLFTGDVRIGIDDFVQKLVGTIDGISIAPANSEIQKGETLCTIRRGERFLSLASPLTGRILEINDALSENSAAVNSDPYVGGWIAVLEPARLASELSPLTIAEGAARWLRSEVTRFRNFIKEGIPATDSLGRPLPVTLLDGGLPVAGVLGMTDDKTWTAFEREFLSAHDD